MDSSLLSIILVLFSISLVNCCTPVSPPPPPNPPTNPWPNTNPNPNPGSGTTKNVRYSEARMIYDFRTFYNTPNEIYVNFLYFL